MQFLPSTWRAYGVDANDDGRKDPYNPLDAVCAAGRYLNAAGGEDDLRTRDLRLQPRRLVRRRGAAGGAPVRQAPRRPRRLADRADRGRPLPGRRAGPATPTTSPSARSSSARSPSARSRSSAGLTAKTISVVADAPRDQHLLAREAPRSSRSTTASSRRSATPGSSATIMVLQDAYGNRFTYAQLGDGLQGLSGAQAAEADRGRLRAREPQGRRRRPTGRRARRTPRSDRDARPSAAAEPSGEAASASARPTNSEDLRPRLFAYPERPRNVDRADLTGQLDSLFAERIPGV